MINGVIFQRNKSGKYKGVEGDNWYLNDFYPEVFEDFYCENIEKSWYDSDYVDVCNNINFIENYIKLSKDNNIEFRMLLCETEKEKPKLAHVVWNTRFIGYDYAYLGGSYYSAVFSDICTERFEQFKKFELNEYGLFDDINKLKEFILLRKKFIGETDNMAIEEGNFIIYKLYEVVLDN